MKINIFWASLVCIGFMSSGQAEVIYSIRDLGPLWAGGQPGGAFAINLFGEVVGQRSNRSFYYSDGVTIDLDVSGYATDINDKHQIVGVSSQQRAFFWDQGLKIDIGDLGYGGDVYANGINFRGQIVGTALKGASSGFSRAFVYENGIMLDLGTLSGGSSFGFGLNNLGDIVGDSSNQAFIYSNGSMKRIGTLGGAMSFARAINDAGQVVGYSYIPGNALRHAFIFQNGMLKDLTPSSLSETFAYGINDLGQVVGTSSDGFAFMYRNGIAIDLNTIIASNTGWQLTNGADINDAGQIAGAGFLYGAFHAFLLSPVPEPAVRTLIAFGLGLLGLAKRCQPHKIRLGLT